MKKQTNQMARKKILLRISIALFAISLLALFGRAILYKFCWLRAPRTNQLVRAHVQETRRARLLRGRGDTSYCCRGDRVDLCLVRKYKDAFSLLH